jgi:hypothetical protein
MSDLTHEHVVLSLPVDPSPINMTVPSLEGSLDSLADLIRLGLPHSKRDRRDLVARGQLVVRRQSARDVRGETTMAASTTEDAGSVADERRKDHDGECEQSEASEHTERRAAALLLRDLVFVFFNVDVHVLGKLFDVVGRGERGVSDLGHRL